MGTLPTELNHERLWAAIDAIATHNGLSPSALARRAGLSSTAFNKSKRVTADGRPRWPSTESIAKILTTTGADLVDLVRLIAGADGVGVDAARDPARDPEPGSGPGFAEEGEAPWPATLRFPGRGETPLFAHVVPDETASPLYRRGDVLLASHTVNPRGGDRVLVRTFDGAVTILRFIARNSRSSAFTAPTGRRRRLRIAHGDVVWIARILWASQ